MAVEQIKFSVIVVLFYSEHLVQKLILNIKEVVPSVGEIILFDNSCQNLEKFKDNEVVIVSSEKNLGYGSAVNSAARIAKYSHLLILNPDLTILNFSLSSIPGKSKCFLMSGTNIDNSNYNLVFPNIFNSFIRYSFSKFLNNPFLDKTFYYKKNKKNISLHQVDYVTGAFIITNKKTFERLGGFDENFFMFYEETDLCKRANLEKIPVFVTSNIIYKDVEGKSSSINVSKIKILSEIDSCKRYLTKYYGENKTQKLFYILKKIYMTYKFLLFPLSYCHDLFSRKYEEVNLRINHF